MTALKTLTAEQATEAKALRDSGMDWTNIGRRYGCSPATVRRVLDPEYRRKRAEQIAAARKRRGDVYDRRTSAVANTADTGRSAAEDAARLMALIPPDTRSLTGRIFGDPLTGRSALDRRGSHGT